MADYPRSLVETPIGTVMVVVRGSDRLFVEAEMDGRCVHVRCVPLRFTGWTNGGGVWTNGDDQTRNLSIWRPDGRPVTMAQKAAVVREVGLAVAAWIEQHPELLLEAQRAYVSEAVAEARAQIREAQQRIVDQETRIREAEATLPPDVVAD